VDAVDIRAELGTYQADVDAAIAEMMRLDIVARIWDRDTRVWKEDPTEIANRLDWLTIASQIRVNIGHMQRETANMREAGYTDALLLGMGGSSLAPELFGEVFGIEGRGLRLHVLDSTDPGSVLRYDRMLNPARTLFIVSSKSGSTTEMLSFFKHFYNRTLDKVGRKKTGEHFVAITDKGSKLAQIAEQLEFRATFLNNPNIGGRYSGLSFFGLFPAALVGVDLERLLDRADGMAALLKDRTAGNPGLWLGTVMGVLASHSRDKLTFFTSEKLIPFGDWAEQLIAESTGKEGKGILPVVREEAGSPEAYGMDRLFVHLRLADDEGENAAVQRLMAADQPVIEIVIDDIYDLGGQFLLWEFATAVAGRVLGINPFDQPNVEAAKKLARSMTDAYLQSGRLPEDTPAAFSAGVLREFLAQAQAGDYVTLQAFIEPAEHTTAALADLRLALRDHLGLATTMGYGPRYLHSTGQLHKGDGGHGMFLMFTAHSPQDVPIPDEAGFDASSMSFGVLRTAQALGDKAALQEQGRRVIRFDLGDDVVSALTSLRQWVGMV
jgi:glucose-6-phosphate isomerase